MEPLVRLNDFQKQWRSIREVALSAVDRVGESGWLILGSEVRHFEMELATKMGCAYAVGCGNGLDAIEIALRVLGLREGDPVLTTPLSAFASTLAIIRAKGVPVFLDVDEAGLLDLAKVRRFLEAQPSARAFLLPVHLFGHCLNLDALAALRERFNLKIVEDCAQAIGAASGDRLVGTVGEIAAISFYPTKNLGCMGDGGALVTNNAEYAARASALRNYGETAKYRHEFIGMNSRLDEIQAAIMSHALLPRLQQSTECRRAIAAFYRSFISHPRIAIPPEPVNSRSVYHLFPILIKGNRESLRQHLRSLGIETAIHYPAIIPDQPAMAQSKFSSTDSLVTARQFADCELSLPIHPELTERDLQRVVDGCNSWND